MREGFGYATKVTGWNQTRDAAATRFASRPPGYQTPDVHHHKCYHIHIQAKLGLFFNLGFISTALAIGSVHYNDTVLTKVIAEISERSINNKYDGSNGARNNSSQIIRQVVNKSTVYTTLFGGKTANRCIHNVIHCT